MAEFLVVRLGPETGDDASWIAVDDQGTRRSSPSSGPLAQAQAEVGDRAVIALVPAERVLTTVANIPIKSGARLRAALPYALEDQLADDVETLHFAAGDRFENGQLPVAVVSREQMDTWVSELGDAGLEPVRIVPENHGLTRIPGTLSMLIDGDQIFFNDGDDVAFVMQADKPSDVLVVAGAFNEADDEDNALDEDVSAHLIVYCEPAAEMDYGHDWNALRHELNSVDINLLPDGVLPRLAVTVAAGHGINLMQGTYSSKVDYSSAFRPWRVAAMLLLTLLGVLFIGKGADLYRLTQQEAELKAQFTEIYREIRPGDTRDIADPIAVLNSLQRGLGNTSTSEVFLPALQQVAVALSQNSAANVEAISYRAGVIDLRLSAPDVPTLDNIRQLITQSGEYAATIQSTDQVGDRVSSRIQVRGAG